MQNNEQELQNKAKESRELFQDWVSSTLQSYAFENWVNEAEQLNLLHSNDEDWEEKRQQLPVTFENVLAATKRIENAISKTPLRKSRNLSNLLGCNLYMKCEYLQNTGSFKERGALNAILQLSHDKKKRGIIAASAGNHALALAYHGSRLNVPVTVVMPTHAPQTKIANCRNLGAEVIIEGTNFTEATLYAKKLAIDRHLTYVHGFDNPQVIAGQGSLGIEVMEQLPEVDAVIVPVGGGGLLAGIALAVKSINPNVLVFGVEPITYPCVIRGLKEGKPIEVDALASSTIADGLAVRAAGALALPLCQQYVDAIVTVEEKYIAQSVLHLIELEKAVVEGAGAAALAPLVGGVFPQLKNKNVVVMLCGGNIDVTLLGRIIDHGLATDGRLVRIHGMISDAPGGLARFCSVISEERCNIRQIYHDRTFTGSDFSLVKVEVIVFTLNKHQADSLVVKLNEAGFPSHIVQTEPNITHNSCID